eukprot:CAMPEP_0115059328 /NCGR_PEP_ID=MMETSP0227-20121206/6850_1 /TAXON_ID=89957 /ORGANISM="Polarella glacialis, Strain CCMP 1383" /LENGTH=58 /DNA_ID=CAMNT_0002444425 /DNA_START=17 /DNA_END=193 /DNA_ORIENTATION=-
MPLTAASTSAPKSLGPGMKRRYTAMAKFMDTQSKPSCRATPGRCTFTATSTPSWVVAL